MFLENCGVVVYVYRACSVVEPEMAVKVVGRTETEPGDAAQPGGSEGGEDVL